MSSVLTADEKTGFEANGYTVLGPTFTAVEVRAMGDAASNLLGLADGRPSWPEDHLMRSSGSTGHVRVALHLCHRSDVFRAHALNPIVTAAVGQLFGSEPAVLTSLLFHKPPHIGEQLTPHQDLPYYPYLSTSTLITCWTALTETNETNGCIHYLEASHRRLIDHRSTGAQQSLDIEPSKLNGFRDTPVPLAAGDSCMHHGLTAHYSGANRSPQPRIGVAVLYVPGDTKVAIDDFPYPLLHPGRT